MTRSAARCVLLMGVLGLSGIACDDRNEGPPLSPSPNPAPPPAPVVVSLTLTGNANLSAVGETSQLTVTANYNDGSTKDVSKETRWTIGDRRVVTVSTEGLLTVVGLGRTSVFASYSNRNAFTTVTATPPGTFVISGRVREPGQGGVLDAMITDRGTGLSAMANSDGIFQLAPMPTPQARLGITKAEYEPRELDATSSSDVDAPMQRIVRVTAGDSVEPAPLAPNDLSYDVDGVKCDPCRMIRVAIPTTGDMQFVLTWDLPAKLILYAGGMTLTGDSGRAEGFLTISTPRELVVYVGANRLNGHTKFKLATTLP
jgi:Bacterial Ig-like domain (group 2)